MLGGTPADLRLELAAAVGLLVTVLGRSDTDAVLAAVCDDAGRPAPGGSVGDRFLRTTLACWPAAADAVSPALGRTASAAFEGFWAEAVAVEREPVVVEVLFGTYRATVAAVSRRADIPVSQVHALVGSLCAGARRAAFDGEW